MALRPCHECGREISTTAKTCPHCGAPSKLEAIGKGCQAIGYLLTLFVTVPLLFLLLTLAG